MNIRHAISLVTLNILLVSSQRLSSILNDLTSTGPNSPLSWFNFGLDDDRNSNKVVNNANRPDESLNNRVSYNEHQYYDMQPTYSHSQPNQNSFYEPSGGCSQYFSYRNDYSHTAFGLIMIPSPDRQKNVVKALLTVSARIPPVSTLLILLNMKISKNFVVTVDIMTKKA